MTLHKSCLLSRNEMIDFLMLFASRSHHTYEIMHPGEVISLGEKGEK